MSLPSVPAPAEEPFLLIQKIAAPITTADTKTHPSATPTRRPTFEKRIEKNYISKFDSINMKSLN